MNKIHEVAAEIIWMDIQYFNLFFQKLENGQPTVQNFYI